MAFVIDASVAFTLIVEEADSARARRLAKHATGLIAPDLLLVEMANALWKFVRRAGSDADRAQAAKEALAELVESQKIDFVDCEKLAVRALALALELAHPVYDCVYLALALAEDVPMVTADRRFIDRVRDTAYAETVIGLDAALAAT